MVLSRSAVFHNLQPHLRAAAEPAIRIEGFEKDRSSCPSCGQAHPRKSKFCTNCGKPNGSEATSNHLPCTPAFAEVKLPGNQLITQELQAEMGKLLIAIARERFFLYFHWLVFLSVHILGFLLAFKVYQEVQADEASKILFSLTPLLFLNLSAFFSLAPIKSTRMEIVRLKERLTYLHYQFEYRHLG